MYAARETRPYQPAGRLRGFLPLRRYVRSDFGRDTMCACPPLRASVLQSATQFAYIEGVRAFVRTMEINARGISGLDPGAIPGGSTNPSSPRVIDEATLRGRSAST